MRQALKKLVNNEKTPLFIIFGMSLIFLTLIIVMAALARMIADDFEYFSKPTIGNPLLFVADFWHHSGRLTQGFIVSSAYVLFGETSVKLMPLLLIGGLGVASTLLASLLLPKKATLRFAKASAVGVLFTFSIVFIVPSTFDSFFWLTASTIYASSLVYLVLFASVCIWLWRLPKGLTKKQSITIGIALFLGIFTMQMISEPASILVGVVSGLLMVYSFLRHKRQQLAYYATALTASIAGFLMIYLSAGSSGRREKNTLAFEPGAVLQGALSDFIRMAEGFLFSWKLLLVLFFSAVIIVIYGKLAKKYTVPTAIIGIALAVIPPLMIFAMTHYSIGYTAMRAFSVPSLTMFAGFVLLLVAAYSRLPQFSRITPVEIARIAIVLIAPLLVVSALPEQLKIIRAESLRSSMLTFRADYIEQQKAEGAAVVILPPAPLLLDTSEAIDVGFNHEPGDRGTWLVKGLKQYYGLVGTDVDVNSVAQPLGYCMSFTPHNRFGERTAQSCYDLSRHHY